MEVQGLNYELLGKSLGGFIKIFAIFLLKHTFRKLFILK